MHKFDEAELLGRLGGLPALARVAFAAACAERLYPTYARYIAHAGSADSGALRGMLDTAWSSAAGLSQPGGEELAHLIDTGMDLIPNSEEDRPAPELPVAEDFGAAACYALRCLQNGDPQEAAWAARRAYEAMDFVVLRTTGIDVNAPGAEERILANPLIQTELGYQRDDLLALEADAGQDRRTSVEDLRRRASGQAHALPWDLWHGKEEHESPAE
jgi:hypothetical protein